MHLPIPEVCGVGVVGYGDACRLNPKGVEYNLGLDCMAWGPIHDLNSRVFDEACGEP